MARQRRKTVTWDQDVDVVEFERDVSSDTSSIVLPDEEVYGSDDGFFGGGDSSNQEHNQQRDDDENHQGEGGDRMEEDEHDSEVPDDSYEDIPLDTESTYFLGNTLLLTNLVVSRSSRNPRLSRYTSPYAYSAR